MPDSSSPIPRPLTHRWRDVRLRYVPVLVYVAGICLIAWLWNAHWMPGTFTGEVQAVVANVASPQDGQLMTLSVRQFERVTKGQVLGSVAWSPAAITAGLAAIRADLMVLRARMSVDGQRNQLDYQQVKVDQLDQKVDLAIARSRLRFAERELARQDKLRADKIASEYEYEFALDSRDALAAEVKEREQLIADMELALSALKPGTPSDANSHILETIDAAIQAQEERYRHATATTLSAPIDGVVTKIYRQSGENIANGEPLLAISSEHAESIIGFVRQPISFEPQVGDVVVVRSRRGNKRVAVEATVMGVGARLELFTQPLRVRGFDSSQERGLPVLINLPDELALYPGELVDLVLKR